ncbi:MAG: endolytic transglycosylase MltG [Thermomicrobia bacterium]|nr:endolytic transglycosylase MltG [Thermomicrobia bacterium]MCA1723039.1 endolytic transglycosylase MltG [Thermomicrobia bacterium]
MRFLIQSIKIGAIIVVAALTLVGARAAYDYAKGGAAVPTGQAMQVSVQKGESVATIGNDLKTKGLISNVNLFRFYVFVNQKAKLFHEGTFTLQKGMSLGQIVNRLAGTEVVVTAPNAVNVRIPEGMRIEQIPAVLRDAGLGTAAADFLTIAKTGTWNYDFLKDRPAGASLEGFLFPDTYQFTPDEDAKSVITAMLDNFQTRWKTALDTQPAPQRGSGPNGLNAYQALIIASIVEREAGSDADRADIASVYYNRLNLKPVPLPLQADPTVQYAVGNEAQWWKNGLTQSDLNTDNPYNTYKISGLPPTPICSPSLKSIIAALNPSQTDYLFFVAKNDGSGTHAFATTNAEQEANKRKYLTP